jgi:ABC-type nickel/cobalt efflux system permease component RcnA
MTTIVFSAVLNLMAPIQKRLNESLATMTLALRGSRSFAGLLLVAALSLAYGIFHAAGPGHGKTIVGSFLLANEAELRHSFIIGYLVAIVHALCALAVVLLLYYVIRGIFATKVEQANHYIQLFTFGAIAVIGSVMLVQRIMGSGHHHHHDHAVDARKGLSFRNLLGIAVPAGVIPCPGAVAVILFALSLHMVGVSILAVSSISVGMGTTISLAGALVILVKRGTIRAVGGSREERSSVIRRVVEIGGAAILFLFGLAFFLAQL